MHAVLYLGNYWEWSGGFSQYNVWTGGQTVDPEDTSQGWSAFMDFSATFYSNERAMHLFREYVRTIVTRTNTVNGRPYAADPTIMSWQLVNEPRPGRDGEPGKKNLPQFYRWIEETARFIHELDTNHLVSSGSEGIVGTLQVEEYFLEAYRTPSIDYLNLHLWPSTGGGSIPTRGKPRCRGRKRTPSTTSTVTWLWRARWANPLSWMNLGSEGMRGEYIPERPRRRATATTV